MNYFESNPAGVDPSWVQRGFMMSYFDDHEDHITGGPGGGSIRIDDLIFAKGAVEHFVKDLHYHRTRDGHRMLIAEMDDGHLKNTLRLHLRILEGSVDALGAANNPIDSILYEMDQDAAERYIRGFQVVFPQYLFEAAVRKMDIDAIMDDVRRLLNRSEALPSRTMRMIDDGE